jgi:hypothetical protein
MTCREYLPLINDLADGFLNGNTKKKVKGHLSDCRDCSGDFKNTKKLLSLLGKLEKANPGKQYFADVTLQILQKIAVSRKTEHSIN